MVSPALSELEREPAREDEGDIDDPCRLDAGEETLTLFSDALSYWANFSRCSCLTRRCLLISLRERSRSMKWRTQRKVPHTMPPI